MSRSNGASADARIGQDDRSGHRFLQDVEQLDVEHQHAVRRDAADGLATIGQLTRHVQAPLAAGVHQLQGLDPTGDHAADREFGRLAAIVGAVEYGAVDQAAWLAVPNFVTPELHWGAILYMVPVALAPAIEHIGGVVAIGNVTGKNFVKKPGLHRTLLGDGLATSAAGLFGGPPNTTYAEVTGAVMLTKSYNPKIMTWAAVFAIALAFIGKFGVALQSIPVPVMGGILCLLFGSIAVVGLNTLIRHQVDLSEARNLIIVSVTLVFGIGGMVIGGKEFALSGISLCAISALLLNLVLPGGAGWRKRDAEEA